MSSRLRRQSIGRPNAPLVGAALLVAMLVVGASAYIAGVRSKNMARSAVADVESASHVTELNDELEQTDQQLANVQAALEIERDASTRVREDLARVQAKVGQLEQEAQLYRGLLDNSVRRNGISLYSVEISESDCDRCYRLHLALVQKARKYGDVTGDLRIGIRGSVAGVQQTLAYAEIGAPPGRASLPIRLRYFQVVEGLVELPQGFTPEAVIVDIDLKSGVRQHLSERRDWVTQE